MTEPEWLSTNDYMYWRHTPCGNKVGLRNGLPMGHKCKPKKIDPVIAREEPMSYYRNEKCLECGSTVHGPQRGQHSNFHANYIHRAEVKDGFAVSAVKWCDQGHHAFKANAPGAQSLDIMQRNEDGTEERVTMDMCADHAFQTAGPAPTQTMREIESAHNDAVALQRRYEDIMKKRLGTPMNAITVEPHHNND